MKIKLELWSKALLGVKVELAKEYPACRLEEGAKQ